MEYELVHEIKNLCRNNQMRDIFFEEVACDSPEAYLRQRLKGKEIELTEKEFDILALLIMNQRQVFTYEMIMDAIWHNDYAFYSRNALSTHISNLRRKLKVTPDVPDHIKSIRGIGYKFEA